MCHLQSKKNFITYFSDEQNYLLKLIQFFYQAMSQSDLVSKFLTFWPPVEEYFDLGIFELKIITKTYLFSYMN